MEKKTEIKENKNNIELYLQLGIIAVLLFVVIFNAEKVYSYSKTSASATGDAVKSVIETSVYASKIIPKGVPAIYGQDLRVSYDDISFNNPELADATIAKLTNYEDIGLNAEQMARYIKIGSSISCEYCCGAKAIIFPSGERACGCAHSYAMRGLAKYLLTKHPEMADEEILSELGKWKVLFFPEIHEKKAQVLESKGIDSTNYINLASNLYRGIEKDQTSSGGMVGGC